MAFLKGEDSVVIWKEFKRNCNNQILKEICEREFEQLISEITESTISRAVKKMA